MDLKNKILSTIPYTISSNQVYIDMINVLLDYIESNIISRDINNIFSINTRIGTFSQNNNVITITCNNHKLSQDQQVYVSFSVNGESLDGYYIIQLVNANIFTITTENIVNYNRSGTVSIGNSNASREFIKTYLENVYNGFKNVIANEELINILGATFYNNGSNIPTYNRLKFDDPNDSGYILTQDENVLNGSIVNTINFDMKYFKQIEYFLNEEFLYTSKIFKQKKGTRAGIKYAYNIFRQSGVQPDGFIGSNDNTLNILSNNKYTIAYSRDVKGIQDVNIGSKQNNSIHIFACNITDDFNFPRDIKFIVDYKGVVSINNVDTISRFIVGYRLNTPIHSNELPIGSDIYDFAAGLSGNFSRSYIDLNGYSQSCTITLDGTFSNIISSKFMYYIEGSLLPEIYEFGVKPIVHPLGYDYNYVKKNVSNVTYVNKGMITEDNINIIDESGNNISIN